MLLTLAYRYDALDTIGHACGHNLIATAGLAAVVGAAEAIKHGKICGRIVAMGTPAEEGGGGKIKMIRAGAYEDIFCCLMVHPMSVIFHLQTEVNLTKRCQQGKI